MRTIAAVGFAILLALNSGCAWALHAMLPRDHILWGESDYWELKQLMEQRIPSLASADMADLYYLCTAYSGLKEYNKLFPCLDQMERNIQKGNKFFFLKSGSDHLMYWTLDISPYPNQARAMAYLELGNYAQGIAEALKAYEVEKRRRKETDPASARNYRLIVGSDMKVPALLVSAYTQVGDREQARKFLKFLEETPDTREVKPVELAKAYMAIGDFQKAYAASEQTGWHTFAVAIQGRRISGYFYLPLRFIHYKSGYETGHVQEAKAGYDELLGESETKANGAIYWLILSERGRIAEGEGNRSQAIGFYKQAIEVIEQQRSTINTEANKIGFVGDKQQVYHRLVVSLLAEGQAAQAFEYVERAKARALVDLLASKKDFAVASGDSQQVAALVKDLDAADLDAVAVKAPESSGKDVATAPVGGMRSARGVEVRAQLKNAAPELAALVTVTQTGTNEIQILLRPGEVLLEYYYEGDDLAVFALDRTQIRGIKLTGAGLATDIAEFRKALEDSKSDRYRTVSAKLHERLIAPVSSFMTGKQVLIVPHGALHYLPFSALCSAKDCLIDRASLRFLPSASVLPFLKGRKPQEGGTLLALGNPDLGDPKYDLKFAQEEAMAIAKAFPQSKLLVRKQASKAALKTLGSQYTYLHFATHGKFDPDAPMKSGLLLAEEGSQDGFLSLSELYSLRLNADLVTLSACETGLGKVSNGDDVVGLTRGFLYAGSSSIVASLWEVDDLATSTLMTTFYANLKKADKQESLRQAQLTTRQKYPHPFYWAAFQLTGMP